MRTGTSTRGPITAANAMPELIPKTATATAINTPRATSTGTVTATPTPTRTPTATATPNVNAGTFYCAHHNDVLYIGGTITDAVKTFLSLGEGDSVRVTLDGKADGENRLRVDDRDLWLGYDGRLRDFAIYPDSTITSAITDTVGGWSFEIGIPKADLDLLDIAAGDTIGATFAIIDNDGATTWSNILVSQKWALKPQ